MAVVELTKENFSEEALQAKGKVLIDFWATWCGPCRMLSPVVDEIAEEGHEGLKVCKVNIDEQPELAQQYQVMSIPTLLVLKDGVEAASSVGTKPKAKILKMIEEA
ncbi:MULTISPECIES: thioredoxin [Eubacteriales]|uniref:thioredoxin n=1 Tax=Eubacteriales TaxID=186802 RepID=UPI0006801A58|nr:MULTISPECIES: thioredoxin [Eubacteriales]